jgi:uncharacterized protein
MSAMSHLVIRRLLIDMEKPIEPLWCDGDAFRTAFLNALSMSFPVGEQFFIDAVRNGLQALPETQQAEFRDEVQGFIGQEATHRRLHGLYNQHLARLGLENIWEPRAIERLKLFENTDPRHALAATAAYEHFTAVFSNWLLRHPQWLGQRDPRLATLWLWHSAEESEHRSTVLSLYRALGGDDAWRLRWFRRVSLLFIGDVRRQTVHNLRAEGRLWRWRTWAGAASFLFGRDGLVRCTFKPWRDYFRPSFHPQDHDAQASRDWLAANAAAYQPVS